MNNTYKAKSILIGRKGRSAAEKIADSNDRPCFIALFDENNPHTKGNEPREILEYSAHKVLIKNANELSYLLAGNDILINDLEEIKVEYVAHGHVIIEVTQNKE